MGTRRGQAIFVGVASAHAGLFAVLAFGLRPPAPPPAAPDTAILPVFLVAPKPREARRPDARQSAPLPVLSRPSGPAAAPVVAAQEPGPVAAVPDTGVDPGIARALRAGRVGCANPSLLSEAEQLACQDRLEAGSKLAKYIPTPLPPERRDYYDRIVKAKGDMKKLAVIGEHGPQFGCHFRFGGPKGTNGWEKPPHSLKIGPCVLRPPMGPLTVEADIRNPDTVIRDPKKAAER